MTQTITKPSQRSVDYLTDLVRKHQQTPGSTLEQDLAVLTKWFAQEPRSQKDVSRLIDVAKAKPRRVTATLPAASPLTAPKRVEVPDTVLDSKYAIFTAVLENIPVHWKHQEHLFVEVKKYRGKRVVRRLLGSPGGYTRQFMPNALVNELIEKLEVPEFAFSASTLYGEIHQCCGTCGAPLTDDVSLETKQGPICRGYWKKLKGEQ